MKFHFYGVIALTLIFYKVIIFSLEMNRSLQTTDLFEKYECLLVNVAATYVSSVY